jgi:hypothetical protein
MPLIAVASTIKGNEKAWDYAELHQPSPTGRGARRYRIILVNRDGRIAEYREDMGLAKSFKGVREIHIPSLWEHSVEELRGWADEIRGERLLDLSELLQLDTYKVG